MPIVNLTQQFVSTATCPADKARIEYCDELVPGLLLEIRASSLSTYYLRYKVEGKSKYQKLCAGNVLSLADARRMAKQLKAEIALGANPRAEADAKKAIPTLSEFFDLVYLPYAKVHKRSYKRDEQLFSRMKIRFGTLRLDRIQKQDVVVFHSNLLNEGLSPASADHHPKLLRRMLSMAVENGLLEKNPMANFKLFNRDNKVENYLNDEDLGRLLEVLRNDENRNVCNIAMLLLSTGCRLNEILSAKIEDFNLLTRTFRIAAINAKGKRIRTVPLNDAAIEVIKTQLATSEENAIYLFVNRHTGKPYTTIMKVWTRLRNLAGLPQLRLHDLRHSYASFLVNSGRTLYEVQHILGHSQSIVTERYAHLSTATLQQASNSASMIINNAMEKAKLKSAELEMAQAAELQMQKAA
jgi:site-specific recombinase XerD